MSQVEVPSSGPERTNESPEFPIKRMNAYLIMWADIYKTFEGIQKAKTEVETRQIVTAFFEKFDRDFLSQIAYQDADLPLANYLTDLIGEVPKAAFPAAAYRWGSPLLTGDLGKNNDNLRDILLTAGHHGVSIPAILTQLFREVSTLSSVSSPTLNEIFEAYDPQILGVAFEVGDPRASFLPVLEEHLDLSGGLNLRGSFGDGHPDTYIKFVTDHLRHPFSRMEANPLDLSFVHAVLALTGTKGREEGLDVIEVYDKLEAISQAVFSNESLRPVEETLFRFLTSAKTRLSRIKDAEWRSRVERLNETLGTARPETATEVAESSPSIEKTKQRAAEIAPLLGQGFAEESKERKEQEALNASLRLDRDLDPKGIFADLSPEEYFAMITELLSGVSVLTKSERLRGVHTLLLIAGFMDCNFDYRTLDRVGDDLVEIMRKLPKTWRGALLQLKIAQKITPLLIAKLKPDLWEDAIYELEDLLTQRGKYSKEAIAEAASSEAKVVQLRPEIDQPIYPNYRLGKKGVFALLGGSAAALVLGLSYSYLTTPEQEPAPTARITNLNSTATEGVWTLRSMPGGLRDNPPDETAVKEIAATAGDVFLVVTCDPNAARDDGLHLGQAAWCWNFPGAERKSFEDGVLTLERNGQDETYNVDPDFRANLSVACDTEVEGAKPEAVIQGMIAVE